jgi:hypothetical protein
MRPADTSPEAWKVFIELQRKIAPGDKMRQVLDYSWFLSQMSESVLRSEYPDAPDREIFLRMASRRLDADTMRRVYHWDPTIGEHVPHSDHRNS